MAWARSHRPEAANIIKAIIDYMQKLGKRWDLPLDPDTYTYNAYLGALLRMRAPSIGEKAEGILSLFTLPKGAQLSSSSQTLPDSSSNDGKEGEKQTEKNNNDAANPKRASLKPEVKTFTRIMQCILAGGADNAIERMFEILDTMEKLSASGKYPDLRPTVVTYDM